MEKRDFVGKARCHREACKAVAIRNIPCEGERIATSACGLLAMTSFSKIFAFAVDGLGESSYNKVKFINDYKEESVL